MSNMLQLFREIDKIVATKTTLIPVKNERLILPPPHPFFKCMNHERCFIPVILR